MASTTKLEWQKRYRRRPEVRAKDKQYRNARRRIFTNRVNEIKKISGCANGCGEHEPCCLVFHHIDPETKTAQVARLVSDGRKWDIVRAEINKCVVLCANCHRKLHAGLL